MGERIALLDAVHEATFFGRGNPFKITIFGLLALNVKFASVFIATLCAPNITLVIDGDWCCLIPLITDGININGMIDGRPRFQRTV